VEIDGRLRVELDVLVLALARDQLWGVEGAEQLRSIPQTRACQYTSSRMTETLDHVQPTPRRKMRARR